MFYFCFFFLFFFFLKEHLRFNLLSQSFWTTRTFCTAQKAWLHQSFRARILHAIHVVYAAQKHVIVYIGQKNCRDISQVIGRGSASSVLHKRVSYGHAYESRKCIENNWKRSHIHSFMFSLSPLPCLFLYIVWTRKHISTRKVEDWTGL